MLKIMKVNLVLFLLLLININAVSARYIQSDPASIQGGLNTYGYVGANPLYLVDPFGLASCTYTISTGVMSCIRNNGSPFTQGGFVSGRGEYQNSSSSTNIQDYGPIPTGSYMWGEEGSTPSRRNLVPDDTNNMYGRDSFQTHACPNTASCSEGCIAGNVTGLNNIIDSEPNSTLTVLP